MPKSNAAKASASAERQAAFRERQKERLGAEVYKKQESERKKALYAKQHPNVHHIYDEIEGIEMPKLEKLKRRAVSIIKTKLQESTKINMISVVKRLYKYYTKKELEDDNDVIKCINSQPFDYKKIKQDFNFINDKFDDLISKFHNYIPKIYCIFARVRGLTDFIKRVYPYHLRYQDLYEDKRADVNLDDNNISFEKEDILYNLENKNLDYHEKVLYGLLFLIPARRYGEYINCKIASSQPNNKNDDNYNYYYDGKIYIYKCKIDTRNRIEKQRNKIKYILNVPPEIDKDIDKDKEYLLGQDFSKNYNIIFKKMIMKVYNKNYTISEIRRLRITYEFKKDLNFKEKEELSKAMNHSFKEQAKYALNS